MVMKLMLDMKGSLRMRMMRMTLIGTFFYRASGVGEPIKYTRQTTKNRKVTLNPSVVGTSSKTKKK